MLDGVETVEDSLDVDELLMDCEAPIGFCRGS